MADIFGDIIVENGLVNMSIRLVGKISNMQTYFSYFTIILTKSNGNSNKWNSLVQCDSIRQILRNCSVSNALEGISVGPNFTS